MSFLAGSGEMARHIRKYDWGAHPFGRPETWPQALRLALGICLQSSFPTAIYWGSELRLLYNDAWAPIPGPRHPSALGAPAKEVWSDIWHVIEPQFVHLIETGNGVFVEDQMLPMRRFGVPEETYWSYSFTPIRGEDGAIAGVFNSGLETTRNVLSQKQMRFLLDLGEAFRNQADFMLARRDSLARLGRHLDADRVTYCELPSHSGDHVEIAEEWDAGEMANEASREAGVPVVLPWTERGKLVASLTLESRKPYRWNEFEITAADKVLERIMIGANQLRIAEREKLMVSEINHRARNSLAVVQSIIRQTLADDLPSFRSKIEDRIAALSRSHDLLSDQSWGPVEFRSLLSQELAPYLDQEPPNVRLDGPSVRLAPAHAQLVALLLHELTTNAAKYGSLKSPGGSLDVSWSTEKGNLLLRWHEAGKDCASPPNAGPAPPGPDGFGSILLKRVIKGQFGGTFSRAFEPGGLCCEIEIPMSLPESPSETL